MSAQVCPNVNPALVLGNHCLSVDRRLLNLAEQCSCSVTYDNRELAGSCKVSCSAPMRFLLEIAFHSLLKSAFCE